MSRQYKNIRLIQDFIIPALDEETYGDLLEWDSTPGVFKIKWTHKARSSWTEEDSRVFIAWDQLKGRPIPRTHQEFVDSKQRLRAALRNLRTIEDVPSTDVYRRYRITDLLDIRVKTRTKTEIPDIKTEIQDIPALPRRRSRRKVRVEKCMYNDDDSSESWTERIKPPRKPRKPVNTKKNPCLKEIGEYSVRVSEPSEKNSAIENPGPSIFKSKEESGRLLEQKITHVPTKETGAVPKIKVETGAVPKIKVETGAVPKPKLPRSLACILDSQNINYDRSIGPRRTTKVSQEVWASSLEIKQEELEYSSSEKPTEPTTSNYQEESPFAKTMISADVEETPNSSVQTLEASDKSKKMSRGCVPTAEISANSVKTPKDNIPTAEVSVEKKKKSKRSQKKKKSKGDQKKSTCEPSLIIKLPVKHKSIEDLTEKLEDDAQSADRAGPHDKQKPVENVTQIRQPVPQNIFSGDMNSLYSDANLATRLDEDYLTKAYVEDDKECPWFCGKGSSDVVFELEFPEFHSTNFNTPLTALGVRLDALEKLSGFI